MIAEGDMLCTDPSVLDEQQLLYLPVNQAWSRAQCVLCGRALSKDERMRVVAAVKQLRGQAGGNPQK